MLSSNVYERLDEFSAQFQVGVPFQHVCIDGFFDKSAAEQVLTDFPSFNETAKTNEFGFDGLKAVHENLSEISPFYSRLTEYFMSDEFHQVIEKITGIKGLRWGGESMYGGGTHENVNGAELDAHVDFNYDDRTQEHRRLNLLIYLNTEWQENWGGEFELHSDPRNPAANHVKSFLPIFNRAVLMETNERSWHGFPRINLPDEKAALSRKSLALYFYSKERPQEEIHGGHGTFYIQRPLPASFRAGEVITSEMYKEVTYLVSKRDAFLELSQTREIQSSAQFKSLESYHEFVLSRLRLSVIGWAKQDGAVGGYYADDWIGNQCSGVFTAQRQIESVKVRFHAPAHAKFPMLVCFAVDDVNSSQLIQESGTYEIRVVVAARASEQLIVSISASTTTSGVAAGINGDTREVSVLLDSLIFE